MAGTVSPLNDVADDIVRQYGDGDTLMAIAARYGVGYESVRRLLLRNGVTMRAKGTKPPIVWRRLAAQDRVKLLPPIPRVRRRACVVQVERPRAAMVFCQQCDRRVLIAEANACSSRFCKAKCPQEACA